MATADDLMTIAQRFYALARVASNTTTKLQLVCLADDYFRQANEIRQVSSLRFAQARTSQMQLVDELSSNNPHGRLVAFATEDDKLGPAPKPGSKRNLVI